MSGLPLAALDRVLVRLPAWLGDLVMAEPSLRALLERVGRERLTLAGDAHLLSVFDGGYEGVRRVERDGTGWGGHDVAVLFTSSFRSAWTAWRAGIPRRVGWLRDGRGLLLTDGARPMRERGARPLGIGRAGRAPRYAPRPFGTDCAELVGMIGVPVRDTRPRIVVRGSPVLATTARLARLGIAGDQPFLVANVGARPGSAKGYPGRAWARVLDTLAAELDLPVLLTAGPGEEDACRLVTEAVRRARTVSLVAPVASLVELAAVFAGAELVLATDSGPRHLANAVGARVACVAGPTDPRHTADHLERQALVRVEVPCGPCHRELCPLEGEDTLRCMHAVDPVELARRALALVE